MPPFLALMVGYLFTGYILWRDSRKYPYSSAALWLPTLWMMRCGSRTIDFWFQGNEIGRLDPVFIAVLFGFGLIALLRRPCRWGAILSHNSALFLFYGLVVVSLSWASSIENPVVKMFRPVGDLIMALLVATEKNPLQAISTMFRRTAILLIPLSIVLIRYYHQLGTGQDKHWGSDYWIGVTTHKNPLGQLCMVSSFAFLWLLVEGRRNGYRLLYDWVVWLYLGMTFYLFFCGERNSRSSTSILCFNVAVVLFIIIGRMQRSVGKLIRRIIIASASIGAVALVLTLSGSSLQAVVAEAYGKDATLSDRTYLWADVIRIGTESPILGAGYGGFWIPELYSRLSPMVDNRPAEAHNGFLETYANLGLVGVGLLVWLIFQAIGSAAKVCQTDFEYGRVRLVLIFAVVVMNYSEATFPRGTHLWWYGFLVVAVYARPWVNWPEEAIVFSDQLDGTNERYL